MDIGIYTLQFATLIFGGLPSNVVAAGHLNKEGVDESMSCVLTYPSGATAVLSTHSKIQLPNTAVIVGTNGSIQVSRQGEDWISPSSRKTCLTFLILESRRFQTTLKAIITHIN